MDAEQILDRMIRAIGVKNQSELGKVLGVSQTSISEAKRKGRVPAEWLLRLATEKKLNPNWLLTGQGAILISERETIDAELLNNVICVFEDCITKIDQQRSLVISPEKKAKWIVFFYEDFAGKSATEKSKEKVEEKIYAVMKLPHLKG